MKKLDRKIKQPNHNRKIKMQYLDKIPQAKRK